MKISRIAQRSRARRIVMVAFPDAQIIDITRPLEVFRRASRCVTEERGWRVPAYTVELVATKAGALTTSSGIRVIAERSIAQVRGPLDTLLVAGGRGTTAAMRDRALIEWLRRTERRARRLCSVCTGAFLLAEAGLLDGLSATTHWRQCALLAARYPLVSVETDPIFVRAGKLFISAGGRGGQSQFSAQLRPQQGDREPIRDLQQWIADHPGADLSVEALARRAAMSPRNFARVFARA